MGKSTLVRALVKVLTREFVRMSDYAKSLGGVILVVEKTAEAYELRDLIQENAPNRDLVRVLEGPNDLILPMAAVSAAMCRHMQNVPARIASGGRMQIATCR